MRPSEATPVRATAAWAWILLAARPLLLLSTQAATAGVIAQAGVAEAWWASAAWWPVTATAANLAGLALLGWRLRVEGVAPLRAWMAGARAPGAALGLTALAALGVVGTVPTVLIASALWPDPAVGAALLLGPLPPWAVWAALWLFPITTVAVELPTFAGYVLPRLRAAGLPTAAAVVLVGSVLGVQHGVLPFLPARQFFVWRVTMFLPVALASVALLAWRPRLAPWLLAGQLAALAAVQAYQLWAATT